MNRDDRVPAGRERAEAAAITALAYLAGRPDDLVRFLALSGIDPAALRESARQPGFLGGVLDFILGDERLLVDFAAAEGLPADRIAALRQHLEGGHHGD